MATKHIKILIACLSVGFLGGCTNAVDEDKPVANNELSTTDAVTPDSESSNNVDDSVSSMPIQTLGDSGSIADSTSDTAISDNNNTPPSSVPQIDQSGIAGSDSELGELLLTDFVLENEQFVPTSAWICADSIGQSRIYYFYQQGVLDASRSVAIERTLNVNDTLSDITFFWSVLSNDGVLLTSVNRDENGMLLSTGRQYDVNSIRFEEIDSVQTFTAESVLRGRLVCGNYNLR